MDALEQRAKGADGAGAPEWAARCLDAFTAAVNDDLNLPRAFAALFDLVRSANAAIAASEPFSATEALAAFRRMDEVLGVVFFEKAAKEEVPAEIQALLDARAAARKERNWAESDRLRDEIAAAGWAVKDSKDGQTVTRR